MIALQVVKGLVWVSILISHFNKMVDKPYLPMVPHGFCRSFYSLDAKAPAMNADSTRHAFSWKSLKSYSLPKQQLQSEQIYRQLLTRQFLKAFHSGHHGWTGLNLSDQQPENLGVVWVRLYAGQIGVIQRIFRSFWLLAHHSWQIRFTTGEETGKGHFWAVI